MVDQRIRVDKWLWHARFFKSRTLAGKFCQANQLSVNDQKIGKANVLVGPGDVLTFPKGDAIKVVKIKAIGTRRGPASEAQALFDDLSPAPPAKDPNRIAAPAQRAPGSGRPTNADRRAIHRFMGEE